MKPRIVIVTGSRELLDVGIVEHWLARMKPDVLVEGGCERGADKYAARWAKLNGVQHVQVRADWYKRDKKTGRLVLDKSAGPRRNQLMLERFPDATVLAFPAGDSPGTRDCMSRAQRLKMRLVVR